MADSRIDGLRDSITGLEKRLRSLLKARTEAEASIRRRKEEIEKTFKDETSKESEEGQARRLSMKELLDGRVARVDEIHAHDLERIDRAHQAVEQRLKEKIWDENASIEDEEQETRKKAARGLRGKYARHAESLTASIEDVAALIEDAKRFQERIETHARRLRVRLEDNPPLPRSDTLTAVNQVAAGLEEDDSLLNAKRRTAWYRFAGSSILTLSVILLLLLGGGVGGVWFLKRDLWIPAAASAGALFLLIVWVWIAFRGRARNRAGGLIRALDANVKGALSTLRRHASSLELQAGPNNPKRREEKASLLDEVERRFARQKDIAEKSAKARLDALERRREDLVELAGERKGRGLQRAEAGAGDSLQTLKDQAASELEQRKGFIDEQVEKIEEEGKQAAAKINQDWKQSLADVHRSAEEACRERAKLQPSWDHPGWKDFTLPEEFPESIHVGDVNFDLRALAGSADGLPFPGDGSLRHPVELSFPGNGSLLLSAAPEGRDEALRTLFATTLRTLTRFPPAKARFLIIDPVGLGQSFSALMHLADFDESLVGSRIWTEATHIERKLSELTEHLEKVIQKYLRNRYASIDEYNRSVGPMAEAYVFLVITDFPTGFSDLALERLAGILTSGARCGVYPLILHDQRQPLPPAVDEGRFRSNGLVLRADGNGLRVADEVLQRGIVESETPPEPAALTSLLHSIGRQCQNAGRVEVDFSVAAPPEGKEWSLTTENGVRVPLGQAGADRLQHLELGRGTAQHALIAGKTGSGKSTLFHVMITNASLWYGPGELELYLIDYKKGVEFKIYATNRLPHVRVVAIESDREFGLSVLRRIDEVLADRAEKFRKAGVQDFAAYRRAVPDDRLPRSLLMIDEFQEFFTEEDGISQEATLLLDRIVRQGRAFGVHVVLGSQTLGGSYTLAKTTLGQMAVRIALQCNEADSYLILNDDNAAARLLSRPGEAIYNDMSGMVEGNNPFQVVWLPDEVEEVALKRVRARADRDGWKPPAPMTVFEGNVPADIRKNGLFEQRLAKPFAHEEGGPAVWLGEANAIKGPTEVRFRSQGGSNLLIVGQQREAALAIAFTSALSLAAAYPPAGVRFVILDGTPTELKRGRQLSELAGVIPHGVEFIEYSNVPAIMEELDAEVKARLEGTKKPDTPVFLFIHDLQRFRRIRQSDEFDFGGSGSEKPTPDKCFSTIVSEGPLQGVHSIIWCDSLSNVNRSFNRKMLREFEMRILFQMSVTDSSELIDSPHASKLGLYRALLFVEEQGSVEKFRPYAMPDPEWLKEAGEKLKASH